MSTFKSDLLKAKIYENLVMSKFKDKGYIVTAAPDKYFPDYDFTISDSEFRITNSIELKVDYMSALTGNIAIEYSKNNGSKAGVTAGDMSQYIMYLLPDKTETTFRYFICKKLALYEIALKHRKFITPCKDKNGYCYILSLDYVKDLIKPITFNA